MNSIALPQCETITDANASKFAGDYRAPDGSFCLRGWIPRDYKADPLGGVAKRFDLPVLGPSERKALVEKREAAGITLRQLKRKFNITSLNQNGTNYCWCNAVITCLHYMQVLTTGKFEPLSPASVAAPIKGFRNVGGWGQEALKYIVEKGVNSQAEWSANKIDRSLYTPEMQAKAAARRVTEWYDLRANNYDELATCLAMGIPVAIGLNWWGHEVAAIDLAYEGGKEIVVIDNSWGEWQDGGLGKLTPSKATPNDACAPLVQTRF